MLKTKTLLIIALYLFSFSVFGQEFPKKWKFAFQFDNRFSKIRNNEVTVFGAKLGLQYKNLTRFGLGGSFILNPIYIEYFNKKSNQNETNKISFWYLSIFNEWILYKNKNIECYITEQVGYGKPNFTKEINNDIISDVNVPLYINEISGQLNYKINSWVGIGVGVGYRNLWNKKTVLNSTFNAPIYIAKIIVYPEVFLK